MTLTYNSLKFVSVNINGCDANFDYLLSILQSLNMEFDFLILTEIKLSENDNSNKLFEIPNYNHFTIYRNSRGGGIRLYYKKCFDVILYENYSHILDTHESLFVRVNDKAEGNFYVGCIYRPPRCSVAEFNNYLENELFGDRNLVTSRCILLGDFNINIDNTKFHDYQTNNYLNILKANSFEQYVNDLTRCDYGTSLPVSLLDHVWANFGQDPEAKILDCKPSDHFAIVFSFKIKLENIILKIKFRDFGQENVAKFTNKLRETFSTYTVNSNNNVENEFDRFVAFLTKILNKYFPIRTKQISCKRLRMPWLNRDVIKLINKKHKLFIALKQGYITSNYYQAYAKLLKQLVNKLKQNYFKSQFTLYQTNQQKTWEVINNICGKSKNHQIKIIQTSDGRQTTDNTTIPAEFNNYFASIPVSIQNNLDNFFQNYDHLVPFNNKSIFFFPIKPGEIKQLIMQLDSKKNSSDLCPKFLKLCNEYICNILSLLFNNCVEEGIYPKSLKVARLVPVHKVGNTKLVTNYRPISVLPTLNKIFEKCIYKRFDNFLGHCNIISENQFGFMRSRDTQQAALKLILNILPIYTSRECAAGLFLDFSKAFDTIDRNRLLFKAYNYGIRGPALQLLESYLDCRFHYTCINGESSTLTENKIGVPQGSCLGPLLFNLYINDIHNLLKNVLTILFADDSTVLVKSRDVNNLAFKLNCILFKIHDWCNCNKLSLNVNKTKVMVFNSKNKLLPRVTLNSKDVEVVTQYRYLGFVLDNSLKHTYHIHKLISKMKQYRAITFKIGKYFNLDTAKTFYYTMIYSHLCYGTIVWAGTIKTANFKVLKNLQNRIIKNLFCRHLANSPVNSIYKQLKILKVEDICKLKTCVTMYKCLNLGFLPYVHDIIKKLIRSHIYGTRRRHDFLMPMPSVKSIELNLIYQMLKAWNELENSIRTSRNVANFKNKLINKILESY